MRYFLQVTFFIGIFSSVVQATVIPQVLQEEATGSPSLCPFTHADALKEIEAHRKKWERDTNASLDNGMAEYQEALEIARRHKEQGVGDSSFLPYALSMLAVALASKATSEDQCLLTEKEALIEEAKKHVEESMPALKGKAVLGDDRKLNVVSAIYVAQAWFNVARDLKEKGKVFDWLQEVEKQHVTAFRIHGVEASRLRVTYGILLCNEGQKIADWDTSSKCMQKGIKFLETADPVVGNAVKNLVNAYTVYGILLFNEGQKSTDRDTSSKHMQEGVAFLKKAYYEGNIRVRKDLGAACRCCGNFLMQSQDEDDRSKGRSYLMLEELYNLQIG